METKQHIISSEGRGDIVAASLLRGEPAGIADHHAIRASLAQLDTQQARGVALYVHLPFCPSRCLSCDYHAVASHDLRQIDRYVDALDAEIALIAAAIGKRQPLAELHLGGGSPNYLSDSQLARVVASVERYFDFNERTVASLTASPGRSSQTQFELIRGLGFSQIGFEVRDIDRGVQSSIGRSTTHDTVRDVFEMAREAGFESISTDLVYGLPGQTVESVRSSARGLAALAPNRLVCRGFSLQCEGFPHQNALGDHELPSLGDKVAMFSAVIDEMESAGYAWIGLHGFARPSDPWRIAQSKGVLRRDWYGYSSGSPLYTIAVGTSAISELPGLIMRNPIDIESWTRAVEAGEFATARSRSLTDAEERESAALEALLCNLAINQDTGAHHVQEPTAEALLSRGLVVREKDGLVMTGSGRFALHQQLSATSRDQSLALALQ